MQKRTSAAKVFILAIDRGVADNCSRRKLPIVQRRAVDGAAQGGARAESKRDVYYPGTEKLGAEEMRVIACGTGMPQPRAKQAAACFLVELGTGDKFIFDMGAGSAERLAALGYSHG